MRTHDPRYAEPSTCPPTHTVLLGKEANRLEDVQHGLVHDWDSVQSVYADPEEEWREVLMPLPRGMTKPEAAKHLGISQRQVANLRNGHARPNRLTLQRLRQLSRSRD